MRTRRGLVASRRAPSGAAALLIAVATAMGGAARAEARDASTLVVSPERRSVSLRVGEARTFSAVVPGGEAEYAWTMDGAAAGRGTRFELRPATSDVGRHELSVTAMVESTAARHTWSIVVSAVAPPRIVRASPSVAVLEAPGGATLDFSVVVEPGAPTDEVRLEWTVDGAAAGTGDHLRLQAPASGTRHVRVLALSERGAAAMREWALSGGTAAAPPPSTVPIDPELAEIVRTAKAKPIEPSVLAPAPAAPEAPAIVTARAEKASPVPIAIPEVEAPAAPRAAKQAAKPKQAPEPKSVPKPTKPPPSPPAKVEKAKPAPKKPERPKRVVEKKPRPPTPPKRVAAAEPAPAPPPRRTEPPPPERLAALPPTPPAPPQPRGVSEDDVRAMLFRYEQAWRARDLAELRRMGQVENQSQADALARYFADTESLEVIVHVLDLRIEGQHGVVRFTRRDRFRDPAGREVTKESPPIEKTVIRTPEGLRFAPRS